MTDKEQLQKLADKIFEMYRDNLQLFARLKALESLVRQQVPSEKLSKWDKTLDQQTNRILQKWLEDIENQDAQMAAFLDNRGPKFMDGITEPLPPVE